MHCKTYEDGFIVKKKISGKAGSSSGSTEIKEKYYAVALFGDRTDAIVLLCFTLVFGSILLVLLIMKFCTCCCKGGSNKNHRMKWNFTFLLFY